MDLLEKNIDDIFSGVFENDDRIAEMGEMVFEEYFMPYFQGEYAMTNLIIAKWREYAGGLYMPVNIIDGDGEVIYTVPSLFSRSDINTNEMRNVNWPLLVEGYEMRKNRLPIEGKNFLDDSVERINEKNIAYDLENEKKFKEALGSKNITETEEGMDDSVIY